MKLMQNFLPEYQGGIKLWFHFKAFSLCGKHNVVKPLVWRVVKCRKRGVGSVRPRHLGGRPVQRIAQHGAVILKATEHLPNLAELLNNDPLSKASFQVNVRQSWKTGSKSTALKGSCPLSHYQLCWHVPVLTYVDTKYLKRQSHQAYKIYFLFEHLAISHTWFSEKGNFGSMAHSWS